MANNGAKAWRENFVGTFYGINSKTFAVEGVAQISGRLLSKWCADRYLEHQMLAGVDAKSEIERVYGLIDVVEVPAERDGVASTIAILEALHRRAAGLKKLWVRK